jgi:hypothetical protein
MKAVSNVYVSNWILHLKLRLFLGHIWFWYKKIKTPGIPYEDYIGPADACSIPFLESGPKPERIHREIIRKTAGEFLLPLV